MLKKQSETRKYQNIKNLELCVFHLKKRMIWYFILFYFWNVNHRSPMWENSNNGLKIHFIIISFYTSFSEFGVRNSKLALIALLSCVGFIWVCYELCPSNHQIALGNLPSYWSRLLILHRDFQRTGGNMKVQRNKTLKRRSSISTL